MTQLTITDKLRNLNYDIEGDLDSIRNSCDVSSSNFSLHIRVDDIIHANGPIYNSKSDRHDRADEMRQNCRLSKSSFGFCALLLGIPGKFITVD